MPGVDFPTVLDGIVGPGGTDIVTVPGNSLAVLASDDFDGKPIRFRFPTSGCRIAPPEPIVQTTDLMGAISLTQWVGQKPYRAEIDVRLDGFPSRSVETAIKTLEHFAEVHAGRSEPPIVTLDGAVPKPHPHLTWRVTNIADPEVDYVQGSDGAQRCRYFTTVSLVQRVTDRVLVESLKATSKSKGVKSRTITVRAGEEWLFEVARRAYGDPSRAADIATANNLHLGKKLRAGTELRLP
jgi:hypothetical protein